MEKEWIHQRIRKILLDAEGYPERIPDEQIRELEKILERAGKYEWSPKQLNNIGVAHLAVWEKTKNKEHYEKGVKLLIKSETPYAKQNLEIAQAKIKLKGWII